mgnify:CR=1 FL=1|jgi:hypothetical protein
MENYVLDLRSRKIFGHWLEKLLLSSAHLDREMACFYFQDKFGDERLVSAFVGDNQLFLKYCDGNYAEVVCGADLPKSYWGKPEKWHRHDFVKENK